MNRYILTSALAFSLLLIGHGASDAGAATQSQTAADPAGAGQDADSAARWERLQAETEAAVAARREAQERYDAGVREAEAARLRYEADLARHQAELERSRAEHEAYQRRLADQEANSNESRSENRPPARASGERCEERSARNRNRGRGVGRFLGGVAGGLTGGRSPVGNVVRVIAAASVGELLGEAIASLLDCEEQQQAAVATEEAVRGGVGTTRRWESETRPGVTGSSTVIAAAQTTQGDCMTVNDVVIIDGEETNASKQLCRRPPSNRYVRV